MQVIGLLYCLLWNPSGVTFTNGATRATYDWIAHGD